MKHIFIILACLFINNKIVMSQTITFSKLLNQLYYGIDIYRIDIDSVLAKLKTMADSHDTSNAVSSLSFHIGMETSGIVKRRIYKFNFKHSPFSVSDGILGCIKLFVNEQGPKKQLINSECCFRFTSITDAIIFFNSLKNKFIPVSSKDLYKTDSEDGVEYVQFSTRDPADKGLRDITIVLNKLLSSNFFEVSILPNNEFSE